MKRSISSQQYSELVAIAAKRHFCLPEGGLRCLVDSERELLIDALLQELLEVGLGSDDEPHRRGLDIEELIDFVGSAAEQPDVSKGKVIGSGPDSCS